MGLRQPDSWEPTLVCAGTRFVDSPDVRGERDWRMALGSADRVARSSRWEVAGASFHVATVNIVEQMAYVHAVPRHVLYATLDGSTRHSAGQIGRHSVVNRPDKPGAISFTPSGWERRGEVGVGAMRCAHIELEPELVSDIIGSERPAVDWSALFNAPEPKLFAVVGALADEVASPTPTPLLADTLLLAVARRATVRFGAIEIRADDGWLAPAALRRVVARMEEAPDDPPALAALAADAGLGVSAFVRAFRGTTGRTPAAFALDVRLDRAERLVRGTTRSLPSIAAQTGFSSASHLISTFRRRRGVTPGTLR